MKKLLPLFLFLTVFYACSEYNRSHLLVHVCANAYQVDGVTGKNLTELLKQAQPGWMSVQIAHSQYVSEDELEAAATIVRQFAKGSVVFINQVDDLSCKVALNK